MSNVLEVGNNSRSLDEGLVIARLKALAAGEKLTIKSKEPLDGMLKAIRRKRFESLKWEIKAQAPEWVFELTNEGDGDDCCGCCGGE